MMPQPVDGEILINGMKIEPLQYPDGSVEYDIPNGKVGITHHKQSHPCNFSFTSKPVRISMSGRLFFFILQIKAEIDLQKDLINKTLSLPCKLHIFDDNRSMERRVESLNKTFFQDYIETEEHLNSIQCIVEIDRENLHRLIIEKAEQKANSSSYVARILRDSAYLLLKNNEEINEAKIINLIIGL